MNTSIGLRRHCILFSIRFETNYVIQNCDPLCTAFYASNYYQNKEKLFQCLEWWGRRACSTDALGVGPVISTVSGCASEDRGTSLHPIFLATKRGELRELCDLVTLFISCFILLNSSSSSPTLDLILSISTFKTWFTCTTVLHPSLCTIWLGMGPAGALSVSMTCRQPARAVLNCICSKNNT